MNNTTQLEAVNTMLSIIGEAPVNTLDGDLTGDVALAVQILNEVLRDVQNIGWGWNTDYNYPLSPNDANNIPIPDNISHVEFKYDSAFDPVRRGSLVWDRKNLTNTFSKALTATKIVWTLDFTELPEAARRFVLISAGRILAQRILGSQEIVGFTSQDELKAFAKMRNDENRSENRNFNQNYMAYRITGRNRGQL